MKRKLYLLPVLVIAFCILSGCLRKKKDDPTPTPTTTNKCVHCLLYDNAGTLLYDAGEHCDKEDGAAFWKTNMESGGYTCHYNN